MILDPLGTSIIKEPVPVQPVQPVPSLLDDFQSLLPSVSGNVFQGLDKNPFSTNQFDPDKLLEHFISQDKSSTSAPLYEYKQSQEERYTDPVLQFTPNIQGFRTTEGAYGARQGWGEQLLNSVIKTGFSVKNAFLSRYASIPNQINAIRQGDAEGALFADSSYFAQLQKATEALENEFPNFLTDIEQERPWYLNAITPTGAANFWGDSILKNTSFTVANIGASFLENAALVYVTGGAGTPVATVRFGVSVAKALGPLKNAFKTLSSAATIGKIDDAIGILKNSDDYVKALNQANKAFRVPGNGKEAASFALKTYLGVQGEAMIEGYGAYLDTRTKLIEHALEQGIELTPEYMLGVEEASTSAGKMTAIIQSPLLALDNMIMFPKTLGYKGLSDQLFSKKSPFVENMVKDKALQAVNTYTFKQGMKNVLKDAAFKGFVPEAIEEGSQYFLGNSLSDYYSDKFHGKTKDSLTSYLMKSLPETIADEEFIKSAMIGGITGTIMGGALPGGAIQESLKNNIFKGKANADTIAAHLNKQYEFFNNNATSLLNFNNLVKFQQELYQLDDNATDAQKAEVQERISAAINLKNEQFKGMYDTVRTVLESGTYDSFISSLQELGDMDIDQFNTSFNSTPKGQMLTMEEKRAGISQLINEAELIKRDIEEVEKYYEDNFFNTVEMEEYIKTSIKKPKSKLKEGESEELTQAEVNNAKNHFFANWKRNNAFAIGQVRNLQNIRQDFDDMFSKSMPETYTPSNIENVKQTAFSLLNAESKLAEVEGMFGIESKKIIDSYLSGTINPNLESLKLSLELAEETKNTKQIKELKSKIKSEEQFIKSLEEAKTPQDLFGLIMSYELEGKSNAEISSIIYSIYEQHTHNKLEKNYLKELNNNVNLTMESAKRMIDFAVFAQEYASKLEENLEKERLAKENGNVETTEPIEETPETPETPEKPITPEPPIDQEPPETTDLSSFDPNIPQEVPPAPVEEPPVEEKPATSKEEYEAARQLFDLLTKDKSVTSTPANRRNGNWYVRVGETIDQENQFLAYKVDEDGNLVEYLIKAGQFTGKAIPNIKTGNVIPNDGSATYYSRLGEPVVKQEQKPEEVRIVPIETSPEVAQEVEEKIKKKEEPLPDIEARKAKLREDLKRYDERDVNSLEAIMPNNPNHPIFKVGMKFHQGMNIIIQETLADKNYDGRENDYEAITTIISPAEFGEDGKMTKAAKVKVTLFNTKEEADAAILKRYEEIKSRTGKKQKAIMEELAALEAKELPTPAKEPISDLEAQKADIERRRQEELENRKNKIEVSRIEYTDSEGNIYQVREYEDGHAEYWIITTDNPIPINIASNSSNIYTKEYLEEISDQPISEGKLVEPKRGLVNKINDKYDKELDSLEAELPTTIKEPITDLTEKINTFLGNKQELYSVFENAISRELFEIQCN
jgi:calcineurin-like phosphoesterase family protein